MAVGGKVDYFEEPDAAFFAPFFAEDFGLLCESALSLPLVSFDFEVSFDSEDPFAPDSFSPEDSEPDLAFEYPSAYQPAPLN
jgi:hypothetical protein